jgi:hypothetical protein
MPPFVIAGLLRAGGSIPLPVLTSTDKDVVNSAGGPTVTLSGSALGGALSCVIGGFSATITSNTSSTLAFTMPPVTSMVEPPYPNYDGVNDRLASTATMDDFFNANAWSAWVLFYADTASADSGAGSRYQNAQFWTDDTFALLCMGFSTAGVHVVGGSAGSTELVIPCQPRGWHLAQAKYDGTNLKLRIDAGPWFSIAAANTPNMTHTLRFGGNYDLTKFFDGKVLEMGFADSAVSDGNFDNILAYVNYFYRTDIGEVAPVNFNPATLSLTGWWRVGGYSLASGWTGLASAGSSLGRNLTEATNKPAASTESWPGFHDVVVTTSAGASNAITIDSWSPNDEELSMLLKASFTASPWNGSPSAGTSGNVSLAEPTNPPTAGAAVNGFTPASFDGINDQLVSDISIGTIGDIFGVSGAYAGVGLVYIRSIGTNGPVKTSDDAVLCSVLSGRMSVFLRSGGGGTANCYHYTSGATDSAFPSIAIALNAWMLLHWEFDGANLRIGVNGTWSAPVAALGQNASNATWNVQLGRNTNQDNWSDMMYLELGGKKDTVVSSAILTKWKKYANAQYNLTLV